MFLFLARSYTPFGAFENFVYILFARDYVAFTTYRYIKIARRYLYAVKVNTASHGLLLLKPCTYILRLDVIYKNINQLC